LASHSNAFTSLSWIAGNQVRVNHLTPLQQSMSDSTNEPSGEPIREPTNNRMVNDQTTNQRLEWDAELHNILSPKYGKYSLSQKQEVTSDTSYKFEAVYGVNHDHDKSVVNKRVPFSDKWDSEILSESPVECNSRSTDSNSLRRSAERAVSSRLEVRFYSRISFKQRETCSAFRMVACEHQCLKFDPFISCWNHHQRNETCNAFRMIAHLDFNQFPQNSVKADSDFRDLQCQLLYNTKHLHENTNDDNARALSTTFPTLHNRMTPSLSFEYIVESISVGARFANYFLSIQVFCGFDIFRRFLVGC